MLGITSESFEGKLSQFIKEREEKLAAQVQEEQSSGIKSINTQMHKQTKALKKFKKVMNVNFMRSLANPGEAVGVLAALVCHASLHRLSFMSMANI